MKEICTLHRLSATDIVDEWISFATTKKWDHEPTLARLEEFERRVSKPKVTKSIILDCNRWQSGSRLRVDI